MTLLKLYRDAGEPSLRTISAACGISHAHVARVINGEQRPGRFTLALIAGALTDDRVDVVEVILSFDMSHPPRRPQRASATWALANAACEAQKNPGP